MEEDSLTCRPHRVSGFWYFKEQLVRLEWPEWMDEWIGG